MASTCAGAVPLECSTFSHPEKFCGRNAPLGALGAAPAARAAAASSRSEMQAWRIRLKGNGFKAQILGRVETKYFPLSIRQQKRSKSSGRSRKYEVRS